MSDVDTTKREIDEHEQKGEPHHTRYSDSEARTAVDGANVNIAGDAETVDGKHASDLGGEPNVPGWEEDANSPLTITSSTSGSQSLATTHDKVWVFFDVTNLTIYEASISMRVNGDTGSNYSVVDADGSNSTGNNDWPVHTLDPNASGTGSVKIEQAGPGLAIHGPTNQGNASSMTTGNNTNVSHPVTSVSFRSFRELDVTAHIYGWNP